MRVYMDGTLSDIQETFLPSGLWFANPDEDFNWEITENCIRLDGLEVESSVNDNKFTCRWKGVELCHINNGEVEETEEFELEDFIKIIKDKNMRLVNMDGYYDTDVKVKITSLTIVDYDDELVFDQNLIDEIEFINY